MPTPRAIRVTLLTLAIVLAGCASGGTQNSDSTAAPGGDYGATAGTGTTVTGEVAGDAELESGCLWLETAEQRYELRLPEGYTADTQALEISTPDGTTFGVGDALTVTGVVRDDLVTICQVGPVIEVQELTAA